MRARTKLFLRRLTVVAISLAVLAGLGFGVSWKAGLLTGSSAAASQGFNQQTYIADSNWLAGTAPTNVSAVPPDGRWPAVMPAEPKGLPVLDNSCSGGMVTFTFDDGPDKYTLPLAAELLAEHVPAVFFEIGDKVAENPGITKLLAENHFVIGNHTYNHESLTGASFKNSAPLTKTQVIAELNRTQAAVIAAGAPKPVLWRGPYDDVNQADEDTAAAYGLRLVMSYGLAQGGNIQDSNDWSGNSPASIASHVDTGYTLDGSHFPGMTRNSILSFHDGTTNTAPSTIKSIPLIVAFMNRHHLCATAAVRPDATGGVVSQGGVSAAGSGNG